MEGSEGDRWAINVQGLDWRYRLCGEQKTKADSLGAGRDDQGKESYVIAMKGVEMMARTVLSLTEGATTYCLNIRLPSGVQC